MPITLPCGCGKTLRVADEYAGRRVRCPACRAILTAPGPEPEFEIVPAPERPVAEPVARPVAEDDPGGERDDDPAERPRRRRAPRAQPRDDDRPRKRRRRKRNRGPSAGDVWITVKRIMFGALGSIMLLGAVLMAVDGLNDRNALWVLRSVGGCLIGSGLLFFGITGRFVGEE